MKNCNTIFFLIFLSVLFVPFAYVYVIFLILKELVNNKYETIKYIKDNKYLLLISISCLLSIICSNYTQISSFFGMMIFVCILAISYVSLNCDGIDKEKLLTIIYITALITCIIGAIQMIDPSYVMPKKWVDAEEYNLKKRMFSTFFNPNVFGFYLNIIILTICVNLGTSKNKNVNIIEKVTFIFSIVCLFFTFSRTSWISLILSLSCIGILFDRKYLGYVIILFICIFVTDAFLGINRAAIAKLPQDGSFSYRIELWKTSLRIIKDNLITGIGFGTFFKYTSLYSNGLINYIEHCHNIYLQILMESGVVGFTTFLLTLVAIIKRVLKEHFLDKSNKFTILIMLILCMTLIHGVVDSVSLTPQIMIILSCLIGISLSEFKSYNMKLKRLNSDV